MIRKGIQPIFYLKVFMQNKKRVIEILIFFIISLVCERGWSKERCMSASPESGFQIHFFNFPEERATVSILTRKAFEDFKCFDFGWKVFKK